MSSLDFDRLRTQVCNGVKLPDTVTVALLDEIEVLRRERDEAREEAKRLRGRLYEEAPRSVGAEFVQLVQATLPPSRL